MTPELISGWDQLMTHAGRGRTLKARDLFNAETDRLKRLSVSTCGLYGDVSKHAIDAAGWEALFVLCEAADLKSARRAFFKGAPINTSENRPALHMALRAPRDAGFEVDGVNVSDEVAETLKAMRTLSDAVRLGTRTGLTGRPIRTILHLGIGGSDLGPRLVYEALKPFRDPQMRLAFAANVDPADINDALDQCDPETTLVVMVSKSFSTQETLMNAEAARAWLVQHLQSDEAPKHHFAAVTANPEKAMQFGVNPDLIFGFRDWVGGRYSVWSAVGLSLMIGFKPGVFEAFLEGADAMDRHFYHTEFRNNLPVLTALAGIWQRNVMGRSSLAVIPYAKRMGHLSAFLQQLEMESNGKGVGKDGQSVPYATCPVVFGLEGSNAQHAFFQQIHQGPDVIPVDFIVPLADTENRPDMHKALLSNAFAQAEALMLGKSPEAARAELIKGGVTEPEVSQLAPQKAFTGNRPSTTITLNALTPETLGALIALYEHKVFVQSVLWGINAFDQWGVELGKVLAKTILPELTETVEGDHDPSTQALIRMGRTASAE